MVFVVVRLVQVNGWTVLCDFEQFQVEMIPEFWCNDWVTVLSRKDKVIIAQIYRVTVSTIGFLC